MNCATTIVRREETVTVHTFERYYTGLDRDLTRPDRDLGTQSFKNISEYRIDLFSGSDAFKGIDPSDSVYCLRSTNCSNTEQEHEPKLSESLLSAVFDRLGIDKYTFSKKRGERVTAEEGALETNADNQKTKLLGADVLVVEDNKQLAKLLSRLESNSKFNPKRIIVLNPDTDAKTESRLASKIKYLNPELGEVKSGITADKGIKDIRATENRIGTNFDSFQSESLRVDRHNYTHEPVTANVSERNSQRSEKVSEPRMNDRREGFSDLSLVTFSMPGLAEARQALKPADLSRSTKVIVNTPVSLAELVLPPLPRALRPSVNIPERPAPTSKRQTGLFVPELSKLLAA